MQEGEGDEEGGSLDRELRARGQRQPDLLHVGRDDDDDAASGDGDCDHLGEICRVHGHDPGEAGRPGEGQPDARTELAADLEKVLQEVLRRKIQHSFRTIDQCLIYHCESWIEVFVAANVDLKRKEGECNPPEKDLLTTAVQVQQQEVDGADTEDLQE